MMLNIKFKKMLPKTIYSIVPSYKYSITDVRICSLNHKLDRGGFYVSECLPF